MAEPVEIVVAAGQDDLLRFGHCDPLKALEELIWNSFDADATLVQVESEFVDAERLSLARIIVRDNGTGFETDARNAFGTFGESLKRLRDRTGAGRIQHGREGKGRYRALRLGLQVQWDSVSREDSGDYRRAQLRVTNSSPNRFRSLEVTETGPLETGVQVTITDPSREASNLFQADLHRDLAMRFAPRLLADSGFRIEIDSEPVLIEPLIEHLLTAEVEYPCAQGTFQATISVCVWKQSGPGSDDYNRIFLCSESGFAAERLNGYVFKRGITYSAFVRSDYFNPSTYSGLTSADIDGGLDVVATGLAQRARELVNQVNREVVQETARSAIERLKEEEVYPFDAEPTSALERAEQQVFDVLAQQYLELHPSAANKPPDARRSLMKALKAAVTSGDEAIQVIFEHVLGLTTTEQREFKELLDEVRLPKIISFARTVTDRLAFVNGLQHILFDPDVKKVLKERSQLHRLLADHLWVFGEEFHLGTDDSGLRNVLRRHRSILGLDEAVFDPDADYSNLSDIPDLMLFKQIPIKDGEFEFLVVELKAPKDPLGEKEFNQIKKYARAVATDPQFTGKWHFILVNNRVDEALYESEACQRHRPRGLLVDNDNQIVWVKRWNEIIGAARGRHEWLKRQLDIQMDSDRPGLRYLANKHANIVPMVVLDRAESLSTE